MLINKMESQAAVLVPTVTADYTVKIGTGGVYDVGVICNTSNDITVTVPDGTFMGQPLLIVNKGSGIVTISANGGTFASLEQNDCVSMIWDTVDWATAGGSVVIAKTVTTANLTASSTASLPDGFAVTGILANSAGPAAGAYLTIVNEGTTYKIALLEAGSE